MTKWKSLPCSVFVVRLNEAVDTIPGMVGVLMKRITIIVVVVAIVLVII